MLLTPYGRLTIYTDLSIQNTFYPFVESGGPVWARFYDLKNEEPLFCDRDGVPRKSFSELGYERRNGYSWYNQAPESLNEEYQHWKEKYM